ncbi:MAG: amidohydrolase [Williamsia sp.]|nr:amidohydrolase [Williamsia sp.]
MRPLYLLLFALSLFSCSSKEKVDLLVYNAVVYTVDSAFTVAQALAVKEGKIVATGSTDSLKNLFQAGKEIDAKGGAVYPGFIDAHTHFYRYALGLYSVNLVGTNSWQEILDKLKAFAPGHPQGWLMGRGWDQNDWPVKEFPTRETLDELFPDRPVMLTRIDGHAAIVNGKALELAGVRAGTLISGGVVETKGGQLTGILVDNAVGLVSRKIPAPSGKDIREALLKAQTNCFAVGLTTVDDCGLDYPQALFMDSLQKRGELKMRVYAMLSDARANYEYLFAKGPLKTDRMNVRSFKVYADGALGSRGACLLEPYSDRPGQQGFLLSSPAHFDSVAGIISQKGFQMCTHAIGDSGNRTILHIYAKYLRGKNDLRWRIEHAQVINEGDFSLFGTNTIVPSVQPTHATSDMYWAADRLGAHRVKGAYAYKQLLEQNGWIPLGTDFPVEDISPLKTFYAATIRKDAKGWPAGGYQMENALSRQEALRGMTIWAARSNFEEGEKGSLERGKWADFILLDRDLMKAEPSAILQTNVTATYINGALVHQQ